MGQPSLFAVTGCSGGGKSTLLDALASEGFRVVPEPGLRILAEGGPFPWDDLRGFLERASEMSQADYLNAQTGPGPVFFDRGVIDAETGLAHVSGRPINLQLLARFRMSAPVFLAPPWPEIYQNSEDRRHPFDDAVAEHERISTALRILGYDIAILPKASVTERLAFVRRRCGF